MQAHPFLVLSLSIGMLSCGDAPPAEQPAAAEAAWPAEGWALVDLSTEGLPLEVHVPTEAVTGQEYLVAWNDEFGRTEVTAGDHFSITISEEPGDIARLKSDLQRDFLQTHEMITDTTGLLVYRSKFPDEDLVFIHFYQMIEANGRQFVVQDAEMGRFNEADVEKMVRAVKPLEQPA